MKRKLNLDALMVKSFFTNTDSVLRRIKAGGPYKQISGNPCSEVPDPVDNGTALGCPKTQYGENTCGITQINCTAGGLGCTEGALCISDS